MTHDQPPMVGEGSYGEGQPLSADDDIFYFFLVFNLKLQFQSGTHLLISLDPPLNCLVCI